MFAPWYELMSLGMRVLLWLFARLEIERRCDRVPNGGLIVVANHLGTIDPPVVGTYVGRRVHFMAKESILRHRWGGLACRLYGAFPVNELQLSITSLRRAENLLSAGRAIGIFPEGHRSRSGVLKLANPGVGYLAARTGVQLLPVGIVGSDGAGRFFRRPAWSRRPRIRLVIGEPFRIETPDGKMNKVQAAAATEEIMVRIAELLPHAHRGAYAAAVEERAAAAPQLHAASAAL